MPPSVPESVGEMLYSSPLLSVKIGFLKFTRRREDVYDPFELEA